MQMTTRARVRALLLTMVGVLLLTGCDFDVYQLPLPGGTDTGDRPMTVTVVPATSSTWSRSPRSRSTT